MKILITGAHFTPAIAVIEEFRKNQDIEIVYVGRKTTQEGDSTKSQESKILPFLGVKFIPIITGRLQRSFTIYTIPSLLKIPIGFLHALYIVLTEKPDVILSFGGYVAVPLVIVGWLFSVPIIVHEQTLVSGLANKISTLFANKIALSFSKEHLQDKKSVLIGNPLREEILNYKKYPISSDYQKLFSIARKEKLKVILIMGGNQGSHSVNKIVEQALGRLTKIACIIHISGDNKFRDYEGLEKLQNEKYLVKKWIGQEIGKIYSKVDLVISRAGANTLTELAFFAKPSLVIPFEPLFKDEQNKNASFFRNLGLVKILPQSRLKSNELINNIKDILDNLNQFKKSAREVKNVIVLDATKRLVLETIILAQR